MFYNYYDLMKKADAENDEMAILLENEIASLSI